MSKLDELIKEYCPDGVEYKRFDEVCTLHARIGWQRLTKAEYLASGDYMLVTGTDFTSNHTVDYSTCVYVTEDRYNQDTKIQLQEGDILITKDGTLGKVAQVIDLPKPATLNGGVFVVRSKDDSLEPRFILHFLLSGYFQKAVDQQKTGSTISHLTQGLFSRLLLPVPPLEVQREIVRVLDKFTLLTAELTAELTARKKQYEYYRDSLLSKHRDTPKKSIDSLCNVSAGGDAPKEAMSKEKTDEYTIPIISNGVGDNAIYGYTNEARITEPAVTVAARGTIGYAEYRDYPYVPIIRLLSLIPKNKEELDTKYLYYCLQGKEYNVPTTGIPQLTAPMVKQVEIPVPQMNVQKRIVEVLDSFDKICADLNIGLPAELDARQKQYEFYRDQLLTFIE